VDKPDEEFPRLVDKPKVGFKKTVLYKFYKLYRKTEE